MGFGSVTKEIMKSFLFSLCFVVLCTPAFAQDVAKVGETSAPKTPPDQVVIPASAVVKIESTAQKARIKQLEAENYLLKAEAELKKLQDEAKALQDSSNSLYLEEAERAGIPRGYINDYEGTPDEKGGFLILKRKSKPPISSSK